MIPRKQLIQNAKFWSPDFKDQFTKKSLMLILDKDKKRNSDF